MRPVWIVRGFTSLGRFQRKLHQLASSSLDQPDVPQKPGSVKSYREIPGPPTIPFLGNFLNISAPGVGNDPKEIVTIAKHMYEKYGELVRVDIPLRPPIVFVFSPELAEKVYRVAGSQPIRTGFHALNYWRSNDSFFKKGKGLLVAQKEEWASFRSKVQQPMLRPKSALRYCSALDRVAQDFIDNRILPLRDENNEMPGYFIDELYKWALESVALVALNVRLGCLDADLPSGSEQVRIIEAVSTLMKTSSAMDSGPQLWRFFPSKQLKAFVHACNVFKETSVKYIHASIEQLKKDEEIDEYERDKTLLERMYERGCDESTLVVMALDMIFAGVDTSSHTIAFTLYNLAKHPRVQDKLFEEIANHLPSLESEISEKMFDHMPYLRAVIKESLRMYPPAIANSRLTEYDYELGGYMIPAGSNMIPFHHVMSNHSDFIKDPEEFRPERWIKSDANYEKIHPFAILPFGHGPRMCVGRRVAELEISILLTKLVRNFQVDWRYPDMKIQTETLAFPVSPLRFQLDSRKS